MKEVKYDDLKGDTQVFHMWEPLKFEIKLSIYLPK